MRKRRERDKELELIKLDSLSRKKFNLSFNEIKNNIQQAYIESYLLDKKDQEIEKEAQKEIIITLKL